MKLKISSLSDAQVGGMAIALTLRFNLKVVKCTGLGGGVVLVESNEIFEEHLYELRQLGFMVEVDENSEEVFSWLEDDLARERFEELNILEEFEKIELIN